jgi:hypothetical protein
MTGALDIAVELVIWCAHVCVCVCVCVCRKVQER